MEINNDNYKILHENILKESNVVKFIYNNTIYRYNVRKNYLSNTRWQNDIIFNDLQLIKEPVAAKAYGYSCGDGAWPECYNQDYAALTRLVIFLFEEIERRENSKTSIKSISSNSIKTKINIEPQLKIKLK